MHVHAHMHRTHILARIHLVRRDIFRHLRRGLVGAAPLPRPVAAGDKTISDWTFGLRLHSDWISVLPLISCVGEGYSLIRRFSPCLCTCHGSIVVCRPSSCWCKDGMLVLSIDHDAARIVIVEHIAILALGLNSRTHLKLTVILQHLTLPLPCPFTLPQHPPIHPSRHQVA